MTEYEQLGLFCLKQREDLPKVSRDSLLLAEFATLHRGDRVCDLGCGAGVLAICLANREAELTLDGIDILPDCAELTRENLSVNGLSGTVWQGDVGEIRTYCPAGGYDLVISNPPYFRRDHGKTAPGNRGIARTGETDGIPIWCRAARWLLRNGGKFAFCSRPEALGEWMTALEENGLAPKRMQLIQSSPDKGANLLLMEAVRQGKPGLEVLPVRIQR